jgi:signal transduction histidine kinase
MRSNRLPLWWGGNGCGKMDEIQSAQGTHLTPEILVPKLGDYLVFKGFLSTEDLNRALTYQQEQRNLGNNILMGQILLELGLINKTDVDQAITEQILSLRAALQESNQKLEHRVQERTKELQDALKRLSELNQLKSNIIANISHEFRTPLTHIKGYIELLSLESLGSLTSEQSKALTVMRKSSNRLEELIDGLIQFSLASQGELTLTFKSVHIPTLLQNVITRCLSKAHEKNIDLQIFQSQPILPTVKADQEKIIWVLLQLIDNGIKFSSKGSKVILGAELDGECVLLYVSDNGIGIPKDKISEIWEPFHQLDGTSTRRFGGTGLGLALVKQIVEAHGSIVRVYSTREQGTRFEFPLSIEDLIQK